MCVLCRYGVVWNGLFHEQGRWHPYGCIHSWVLASTFQFLLQLGTHLRAKRKREEMSVLLRKAAKK